MPARRATPGRSGGDDTRQEDEVGDGRDASHGLVDADESRQASRSSCGSKQTASTSHAPPTDQGASRKPAARRREAIQKRVISRAEKHGPTQRT